MFDREVSHDRAREAAKRLIHDRFNPKHFPESRATIPANADDDDLVICDYIEQQRKKESGVAQTSQPQPGAIEDALHEIGQIVLRELRPNVGFIFRADDVRTVLQKLARPTGQPEAES